VQRRVNGAAIHHHHPVVSQRCKDVSQDEVGLLKASTSRKPHSRSKSDVPRRPATFTQADVVRAIRAAKQAGANAVEVRPDGTIVVLLKEAPLVPAAALEDPFTQWEREYESEKAARRGERK
jgi:hypothetical protein